ncbi:10003_t:CDS:2, partial [Scutellospora calospora]
RKELAEKKRNKEEEFEEVEEGKEFEVQILEENIPIQEKEEKKVRIIKELLKTTYYYKFGASSILTNATKETRKITSFYGTI